MKKILFALFIIVCFTSCKKEEPESTDNSFGLPNITQEGKNTFGCLLDGNLLLAEKSLLYPTLTCRYLLVNYPISGYSFSLHAQGKSSPYVLEINTINKAVTVGEFDLGPSGVEGEFSAVIGDIRNIYEIDPNQKGKIKITKLDEINQIVSGTFWFDAVNSSGKKVEVREGRFDMVYFK